MFSFREKNTKTEDGYRTFGVNPLSARPAKTTIESFLEPFQITFGFFSGKTYLRSARFNTWSPV